MREHRANDSDYRTKEQNRGKLRLALIQYSKHEMKKYGVDKSILEMMQEDEVNLIQFYCMKNKIQPY